MPTNENLLLRPPDPDTPTVATDLEGTLTAGVTVRAMHAYMLSHSRAMEARWFYARRMPIYLMRKALKADLRQFKNDWMRDLLRMFGGYSSTKFRDVCEWVVDRHLWPHRRKGLVAELEQHLAAQRRVLIITGMFEPLLEVLLKRLPGVEAIGTPVVMDNGVFTGTLKSEINVGIQKREQLRPFAGQAGKIHTAYGDTGSDIYMLEFSQHPVAVHPDTALREYAELHNWRILEGDSGRIGPS